MKKEDGDVLAATQSAASVASKLQPFSPEEVKPASFVRLNSDRLEQFKRAISLSSTVSDRLDELGWRLSVPGSVLQLRSPGQTKRVVGQALTLRYLPERKAAYGESPIKFGHEAVYRVGDPGDVMVIEAFSTLGFSTLGGVAASQAVEAGLAGCIIDGSVRDIAQIRDSGLPLWSRAVTPTTGKHRHEAIAVNVPICCGGVQVRPGDLVIADESGVCFVPVEAVDDVLSWVLAVDAKEAALIESSLEDRGDL